MKIISIFACLLFLIPDHPLPAQEKFTISGFVQNSDNGEMLIGATVIVKNIPGTGAATNAYGYYSLTIPNGSHLILVQYLGYKNLSDSLRLENNISRNYSLTPEPVSIDEVIISADRSNKNVTSAEISSYKVEIQQVKSVPVLLGEKDILKTIQLLPGIKSAGEGSTGFYARGGGIDQNLIVIDEAPVYNSAHLLGFLSVFNSDAVKDVKVITGGMPAEYGGRLSSVLDVRTNDGNTKEFHANGGIGLIASRLTAEGPIEKEKSSFTVSGRRTYLDLFLKLSSDTLINRANLYFYDLNAKINFIFGDHDRLFISGYFGKDNFNLQDMFGFSWGNTTATVRWNHIFGDHLFSNTSLIYSNYEYVNTVGAAADQFEVSAGIRDINFKTDFQIYADAQNSLKFGVNSIYHTFLPGTISTGPASSRNALALEDRYALENGLYASHDIEPIIRFKISYGIRLSSFTLLGPGTVNSYDDAGNIISKKTYGTNDAVVAYFFPEPRITAAFVIDEESSVKSSYTRTTQYLHLLSNSTTTNPSDLWVPSSNNVKPQLADQAAVGYFRNFNDNEYETSVEAYYKYMKDIIDYKNGADLRLNSTVESLLLYGTGRSYGIEVLLRKRYGRYSGWIGYTLSKTTSQFANINNGDPYPARQDRTHDISIVGIYEFSPQWTFGATWVYNTGNAVTFPSGNYLIGGRLIPYYTERNGYRMPAYHRLDLSATYTIGPKSNLNISIYNAYNQMNAYSISFRQNEKNPNKTEAVQTTFFPLIPSVTYNFKF